MHVDRRRFIASVGGVAAVAGMAHEDRAEALEHYMTDRLDRQARLGEDRPALSGAGTPRRSPKTPRSGG